MAPDIDDDAAFGKRLKRARQAVDLEQMEVAEYLGVHTMTVSRWERGVQAISDEIVEKLATLYGMTLEELVSGTPRPLPSLEQRRLARLENLARRMIALAKEAEHVIAGEPAPYRPPPMVPLKKVDHKGKAAPKRGRASGE